MEFIERMVRGVGRPMKAGLDQLAEAYFCTSRSRVRTRKKYAGGYTAFLFATAALCCSCLLLEQKFIATTNFYCQNKTERQTHPPFHFYALTAMPMSHFSRYCK